MAINEMNINSDRKTNSTLEFPIFHVENIYSLKLNSVSINDGWFLNKIISIVNVSIISILKFFGKDFYYDSKAIFINNL